VTQFTPDLAALFAVGVLAAGVLTANNRLKSWPWPWLALAAAVPVIATITMKGSVWTLGNLFWVDLAFGPAIGCLLASIATGRPASLVRALDTRPLRSLGSFSYSLYLTHAPIVIALYYGILAGRVRPGVPTFLVLVAVALPVTILFARAFAAVFEIPFRKHRGWKALRASLGREAGRRVDS
jgi:peptidoglycan/LPS O-acetylase OafA/YrhL